MITRCFYAIALAGILVLLYYSAGSFYGRYYFTLANRGAQTNEKHLERLQRALKHDPSYGYADLQIARLLMAQRQYHAALEHQNRGMRSFRPVSSYEQMASIMDKLKKRPEAEEYFQKAVNMRPNNVRALEALAFLALARGDSARMESLIAEISNYDLDNLNAVYLRARDADRRGNTEAAFINYQHISSALPRFEQLPPGAYFTKQEIEQRLAQLQDPSARK